MRADHIKIRTMRYIVMIADGKTVGEVSKHCRVSSACVTLAIQRTENLLGTQIFKRGKRNICGVTEPGKVFVEQFRGAVQAIDGDVKEAA